MKTRSPKDIAAEIAALRDLRPRVRPETAFGESNLDCIDAQIDALEQYWTEDDAYENLDDDQERERDAAIEAIQWASGESDDAPSADWQDLIVSPARPLQLISSDQAVPAKCQHQTPCSDCPWSRKALRGWIGGASVEDWQAAAHGEEKIECHTLTGAQCAGAAIYRANVAKATRDPEVLRLPADREKVFATPAEFAEHHSIFKANAVQR